MNGEHVALIICELFPWQKTSQIFLDSFAPVTLTEESAT